MTRNGKIARLPLTIRQELNERLYDGEQGLDLVEWLNSLPEVQAILKENFAGKAISECNLSSWKAGGYEAWKQNEPTWQGLNLFMDKAAEFRVLAEHDLPSHMALMLSSQMALEFDRLADMPEGDEKTKARRELQQSLLLLRREQLFGEKLRLERQKFRDYEESERIRQEANRPMTAEEKRARINQIMGTE